MGALPNTAVNTSNTIIALGVGFVNDRAASGNPNDALDFSAGTAAATVEADETAVTMDNFEFNLEDGELSMTFSETVDTFTFSATAITIQSEVGTGGSNVTLSGIKAGTSVVRNPVTVLTMLLTDSDMNDIKALSALAIDRNS